MTDHDVRELGFLDASGEQKTLNDFGADVYLVVNVASKCGLTPQYAQLEQLQKQFGDQGFSVIGFPCNQFLGQEPGSMEEILEFCSTTYGVTFPINEKIKVNGKAAAPLYQQLKNTADAHGDAGRVAWNFEKFLIDSSGKITRFRPKQQPNSEEIVSAITDALAAVAR